MDIQIRRAKPAEAHVLTEIAHAAKRHWGYPENWIEHWKDDLTITPEFISDNEVYVAVAGKENVGCCGLVCGNLPDELEDMWDMAEHIRTGVRQGLVL